MSKPRTTIEARRLFDFCEVIGDRHLIAATVGPNLDPVVLSLEHTPDYRIENPGRASLWVSYFDEGVFGSTKLGQSGLVCLDNRGKCIFDYATLVGDEVPSIADCYALNVCSDREVWLCYYTDFPLVRLLDGKPEGVWIKQPVSGSPGFAVSGGLILFAGGYSRKNELFLVQLGNTRSKTIMPLNGEGEPIKSFTAYGRRDRLFLQTKDAVFVISLPDAERTIGGGIVS